MKTFDIRPGQVALGCAGDEFRTLLGSCVSVILTDPRRTVGVMNHILHVGRPNAAQQHNSAYGAAAMAEMNRLLVGKGFMATSCHAYVVGGGNMFANIVTGTSVGARNAQWVLAYLAHHKIPVLKVDVGGTGYRKVIWTVGVGDPEVETSDATEGLSR